MIRLEARAYAEQLCPAQADSRIPGEAVHPPHSILEPAFQPRAAGAPSQEKNAEPHLAQDGRVDHELLLVVTQPFDHAWIGVGLGHLREHVGADEVPHSESVDSDSIATK